MNDNLKWCIEAVGSHTEGKFSNRFPNIKMDERGSMRMGTCLGFIAGLHFSGNTEKAEYFTDSLISNLEHPFFSGGEKVKSRENFNYKGEPLDVPVYQAELFDDGTIFGFSFVIWVYSGNVSDKSKPFGVFKEQYNPYLNGGLLFHGLGEVYAVTLDNKPGWQIHT